MADLGWPRESVILAAQRGDPAALRTVITDAHPHVRRFARSLCATPEDAEDSAQEALIILYRKIGTLRATAALASWLFRIIRNECLRRARQIWPREDLAGLGRTAWAAESSAEDEAVIRSEAERVARAIAELPSDQRRVLVLRDLQGHSGRAVADALGLTTAAMKSRLHRARATLRDRLAEPALHGQH